VGEAVRRGGKKNDAGEKAELTLQAGNGSWDGIVGLAYLQNFSVSTLRRESDPYSQCHKFEEMSSRL
jgi:hypothetical protein